MVFKIYEGISCSSFYDKECDVIVHNKIFFLYNPIKFLAILYPKSLVNLVVEVGTWYIVTRSYYPYIILITIPSICFWLSSIQLWYSLYLHSYTVWAYWGQVNCVNIGSGNG